MGIPTKLDKEKNQARSFIENGQFEAAQKVCSRLSKSNKHDPQVWYLLALTLSQMSKYRDAIKAYKTTLKLSPNFFEANYNLALTYQYNGMVPDAIKYFQKSISLKSSLADAHFGLGNCLCALGKYDRGTLSLRTALELRPNFINAKINLGNALKMLGELDSAEALFSSVVKQNNSAIAYAGLAGIYQTRGESQKAIDSYTKSIEIEPTSGTTWAALGKLYQVTEQMDLAINCCTKAIEYEPSLIDAHHGLAAIYFHTGNMPKSQQHFENVLSLNSQHTDALVGMGSVRLLQGRHEDSLKYAKQAMLSNSSNPNAIVFKAKIFEQMGKLDEAYETIKPLVDNNIVNAAAGSVYANICLGKKQYQDGFEYLETILKNNVLSDWDQQQIHFALGKLYDATAKYDEAFLHYKTANNLKFCKYDPEHETTYNDRVIRTFPRKYFGKLAKSNRTQERPIFIVGMPRSGTSLVEQILSRHPKVTGGGEMTFMYELACNMNTQSYPECLEIMDTDALTQISDEYLEKTSEFHNSDTLLTDKLPSNYLHLGVISLLFPSALIIHCERNPVDTCLSCYFQDFTGDLSFSYNFEDLAHYYKEYKRLMKHWNSVLEIPLINIKYEELIADQDKISHELISFCGLEWDDRCLEFSKSSRFVRTASYDQVRRPIYSSSVERWRNYEAHIEPLLHELREYL